MDYSSLPKYRALPRTGPATCGEQTGPRLSSRAVRTLLDLALLIAITVMLSMIRQAAPSSESPTASLPRPLDFKLVQERSDKVKLLEYGKVVALLGPPSFESWSREPEFQGIEDMVAAHPDRYPRGPFEWEKWTDPKDAGRWVAVFFANGKAYHVLKKGF
jgi:hypothetical protein